MKRLMVGVLVLLAVPMVLLNPMGREAFLGYYAGIITLWLTLACVGAWQQAGRRAAQTD